MADVTSIYQRTLDALPLDEWKPAEAIRLEVAPDCAPGAWRRILGQLRFRGHLMESTDEATEQLVLRRDPEPVRRGPEGYTAYVAKAPRARRFRVLVDETDCSLVIHGKGKPIEFTPEETVQVATILFQHFEKPTDE